MPRALFPYAVLLVALSGCATTSTQSVPCFDGWTRDEAGVSMVVPAGDPRYARYAEYVAPDSSIVCMHQMPTGRLVLLSEGRGAVHFVVLDPVAGGHVVSERGSVI